MNLSLDKLLDTLLLHIWTCPPSSEDYASTTFQSSQSVATKDPPASRNPGVSATVKV
jgi:hypothetical protein